MSEFKEYQDHGKELINFPTEIAGIELKNPVMNAAGTCKLPEDVERLSNSESSAIMVGSITVESRDGNSGDVYAYLPEDRWSINSKGLPNKGIEYYKQELPLMVARAHSKEKPIFVSVAGFSPEEYVLLSQVAFECGVDLVELNLGCPNVWQGDKQKQIACFNLNLVDEILEKVEKKVGSEAKVSVKISPFSDPFTLVKVAEVIGSSKLVKAVTAVNTFPNAFGYDGKKSRITPGGGLGGLAGPVLKPIGLGQVRQLRAILPEHIGIMGVGGINKSEDVWEYLDSGASAVQIATAYIEQQEKIFSSILGGYPKS
ncbi:MAG: hypothetical protein A2980_02745 [Candidatus Staskawiczbacteria bacterium RIFCSPLOWO2_01_FULL_33_13]|nr:MAG: hypothetical protein A2980_02745 [Candidatus Staskawiczbacteria bacterium RIFCSPLOWO2_01_FULL_33_13]